VSHITPRTAVKGQPQAFVGRANRPDDGSPTNVPFVAGIGWERLGLAQPTKVKAFDKCVNGVLLVMTHMNMFKGACPDRQGHGLCPAQAIHRDGYPIYSASREVQAHSCYSPKQLGFVMIRSAC